MTNLVKPLYGSEIIIILYELLSDVIFIDDNGFMFSLHLKEASVSDTHKQLVLAQPDGDEHVAADRKWKL